MKVLMTATNCTSKTKRQKIEFGTQANQWLPCKELRILSTSVVTCAIQSTLAEKHYTKKEIQFLYAKMVNPPTIHMV
jgi:hypothetical protein